MRARSAVVSIVPFSDARWDTHCISAVGIRSNTAPKTANSLPSINSASENALPSSGAVVVNEPVDTSSSSTDDGAAKQRSAESEASLSAGKKAVDVGPARQQQRSQKGTIQLMFGGARCVESTLSYADLTGENADLPADSVKDKSYKGGVVRNRSESPIPEYQLDADGLEIVPDTSSDEERPVCLRAHLTDCLSPTFEL